MPTRKSAAVQLGEDVYELEAASTKEVTLIHRVTGERRTFTHAELAGLVEHDKHRAPHLLGTLPRHVIDAANMLAIDIEEVLTGVGRNGKCRPEYDLSTTSQETRIARKLTEMEFNGRGVVRSSFFDKMKKYQRDGLIGLVDGRSLRTYGSQVDLLDWKVLDVLIEVIDNQKDRSTGTGGRIIRETTDLVKERYGKIRVPSQSAFYTLIRDLGGGKHATGSAKTRRSLGNRPDRPFAKQEPLLPGSAIQVDSNTMDIEVRTPKGERVRPMLSIMTDVYSRSIIAFTIRLKATKGVDHMLLLAQANTPRPNRPSRREWRDALRRNHAGVELMSDEEYEAHSREMPFIRPDTITMDRGTDYVSPTFRSAVKQMGGSVLLSAPYTPTSKPHVERQFETVNTLFSQYLVGYVGRSPEYKGKPEPLEKLLTVEMLRELFEEWVIRDWQNRKHEGLRDPVQPTRLLSPNEKAARAALVVEQLHTALTRNDYIGMLDSKFRQIGSTGIRYDNREYDADELHPLKGLKSKHTGKGGKWEVKVDPYNPTAVWVVGRNGEYIECLERGAEVRWYAPDFEPEYDDDDYRSATAQVDAELAGTPFPQPTSTVLEHTADASDMDDDDDDLLPDFES